jgi:hypothetical protein
MSIGARERRFGLGAGCPYDGCAYVGCAAGGWEAGRPQERQNAAPAPSGPPHQAHAVIPGVFVTP